MTDLAGLVDRHALLTMEKQLHAADIIGKRPWQADLDAGTITFGKDLEMRAEVLGTESQDAGSWLWSWANEGGFEPRVTAGARRLRDLGAEQDIAEFADSELPLSEEINGTRIAFASVGALEACAFYSAPAGGGTRAILLIDHPELELPAPDTVRLVSVLTSTLQTGEIADWRAALQAYASQRGVDLHGEGDRFELGDVTVPTIRTKRMTLMHKGRTVRRASAVRTKRMNLMLKRRIVEKCPTIRTERKHENAANSAYSCSFQSGQM